MIYDLLVVGNGHAAQTFLFELFNFNNNQNFSVAQVYADEISPPCSLRTTATVALSGIEEGISPLGDELRTSYFLFEEFFKKHRPDGISPVVQYILHSKEEEKEKLLRRYQELKPIESSLFQTEMSGVEMDSYLISPEKLKDWLDKKCDSHLKLSRIKNFVKAIEKTEAGFVECTLLNGDVLVSKKILLATGAYSKIFSTFFSCEEMAPTSILAGSYLERLVDFDCPSFFLTLDGNKCVYRSEEKKLVIGSVSEKGAFTTGDFEGLKTLVTLFQKHLALDIGRLEDFKMVTGLRHKGRQRRPIYKALDAEKKIFMISGLYKNGFTFAHLAAREVLKELAL